MTSNTKPARKSHEVYQSLRKQIILAELPAGQQLVELEVAKAMSCSQSTVREALMRLKEDGLIVRQGYSGTVVSSVSDIEGQESLDIRAHIESRAAHFSMGQFTETHMADLSNFVRKMEAVAQQGDEYGLFELDQAFHRAIYEVANLPAMMPILERCSLCSHRYKITQSLTRRTLADTALRHWRIIDALKSGNADELEQVLLHHVASVVDDAAHTVPAATPMAPESQMTPDMARIFKRMAQEDAHLPNPMLVPLAQARAINVITSARWDYVGDSLLTITHFAIPTPTRQMAAVRLSRKQGSRKGTILYIHGGGWVVCTIRSHLGAMARLAELTGMTVVGIDYGLAPEAPFPQGLNDSTWALRWLRAGPPEQPDLEGPWLVSGDSAGANIALSMMLDLRHAGEPLPDAALLFYGVYSADHQTSSHKQFGGGQFGLSSEKMAWYRQHYLSGQRQDPMDPRVSPLLANLHGLPPIFLNAAGLDCLRDDSVSMAQRLAQAGVPHQFNVVEGVTHGFMQMSSELPEALQAFKDAATFVATVMPLR